MAKLTPGEDPTIYAAIMDWHVTNGVATLFALAGDAVSLYFSSGGGIIGAGFHQPVQVVAARFIESFRPHLREMQEANGHALPSDNMTSLWALTNKGTHVITAPTNDFGERRHLMADVFYAAQELITTMRMVTEQKANG